MQLVLCQMVFGTNMLSLFIEHRRIYCVYSNVTWRKLRKYCAYMDLFKSWPHLCSTCYIFFLNNLIFFLNSARETIDPNFRTRESPRISVNVNIRYRWYWISTKRVENREKKKKRKIVPETFDLLSHVHPRDPNSDRQTCPSARTQLSRCPSFLPSWCNRRHWCRKEKMSSAVSHRWNHETVCWDQ